jgi:hypothetical protein
MITDLNQYYKKGKFEEMTLTGFMNGRQWRALLGLLLTMPVTTVFVVLILYEVFHWYYPLDLLESVFEDLGLIYLPQWAGIAFFLVGPVLAFYLNANVFSRIRFETTKEKCDCRVSIRRNWISLAVLFLSLILLLVMGIVLTFIVY